MPMQSVKAWVRDAKQFSLEVQSELSRVTWPNRREILETTVVVIIFTIVFASYLSIIDEISFRAVSWIMSHFGATPLVR